MTLVLGIHSRNSIWVLTDRRLSFRDGRPPIDDAVKLMNLETNDGRGILAYAGLGSTAAGTEPSAWMSNVLRGRAGLTFEQALGVLADAAARELPRHIVTVGGFHTIIVPAFVEPIGPRIYTIDNIIDQASRKHFYRYTSHVRGTDHRSRVGARIVVGGSGGAHLQGRINAGLGRELLHLVNVHDRGKISDIVIADKLASINLEVHRAIPETVGPRSIVIWRRRDGAPESMSGGAQQHYTGVARDNDALTIPTILGGQDIAAIGQVFLQHVMAEVDDPSFSFDKGFASFSQDAVNQQFAAMPWEPDEELR